MFRSFKNSVHLIQHYETINLSRHTCLRCFKRVSKSSKIYLPLNIERPLYMSSRVHFSTPPQTQNVELRSEFVSTFRFPDRLQAGVPITRGISLWSRLDLSSIRLEWLIYASLSWYIPVRYYLPEMFSWINIAGGSYSSKIPICILAGNRFAFDTVESIIDLKRMSLF